MKESSLVHRKTRNSVPFDEDAFGLFIVTSIKRNIFPCSLHCFIFFQRLRVIFPERLINYAIFLSLFLSHLLATISLPIKRRVGYRGPVMFTAVRVLMTPVIGSSSAATKKSIFPPPVPVGVASHLQSAAATAVRPNETIMQIAGRSTVTGHTSLVHRGDTAICILYRVIFQFKSF